MKNKKSFTVKLKELLLSTIFLINIIPALLLTYMFLTFEKNTIVYIDGIIGLLNYIAVFHLIYDKFKNTNN